MGMMEAFSFDMNKVKTFFLGKVQLEHSDFIEEEKVQSENIKNDEWERAYKMSVQNSITRFH